MSASFMAFLGALVALLWAMVRLEPVWIGICYLGAGFLWVAHERRKSVNFRPIDVTERPFVVVLVWPIWAALAAQGKLQASRSPERFRVMFSVPTGREAKNFGRWGAAVAFARSVATQPEGSSPDVSIVDRARFGKSTFGELSHVQYVVDATGKLEKIV